MPTARQPIMFTLPEPRCAPGFRAGLTALAEFRVQDFSDTVLVEPAEGAGAVRSYLTLHRLCDASTDLTLKDTWAPVTAHPPHGRVGLPRRQRLIEHAENMAKRNDFAAQLNALAALVAAVEAEELPALLEQQLPRLFALFPNASVWWLATDPVLVRRFAFLRARLALELTPDIRNDPEEFEGLRLLSAHSLTEGLDFGKAVDPALLAFSPATTGFSTSKLPNGLIFLFGDPVELRVEPPALLQSLYEPRVLQRAVIWDDARFRERISILDAETLLRWWVEGLNVIYSHAADPTGFSDPLGRHDPMAQTAWLLTWERLLADGITLASGVNLPDATRMELSFDLLDKAEQLLGYLRADNRSGKGFKRLLRRGETLPALTRSWSAMPDGPRTRFENHSRKVYEAFYSEMREATIANRVTQRAVNVAQGSADNLVPEGTEIYVAELVRDVRNSAHGFLELLEGDHRFRVATHTGMMPTQVNDIATLIMLAFGGGARDLVAGTWI